MNKKIIVAICGASGSIYGIRLLKALLNKPVNIYLIISNAGYKVLEHETGYKGESFSSFLKDKGVVIHNDAGLNIYKHDDFFAPPASGSFKNNGMVIAPCSMKTLGAIASGIADNLIHRAADVNLKEKRPLILLPKGDSFKRYPSEEHVLGSQGRRNHYAPLTLILFKPQKHLRPCRYRNRQSSRSPENRTGHC